MEKIDWWRGLDWISWLDEPGAVERPVEDTVMRRLALQSARALNHLEQVRAFVFRSALKEVLVEEKAKRERDDWTLREVHAAQGFRLEWRETVTRRGNKFIEVVEVQLPRAS